MSPRMRRMLALIVLAVGGTPVVLASCVATVSSGVEVREQSPSTLRREVKVPVRAHLSDGSTMLFPAGILVDQNTIIARGGFERFNALNRRMPEVASVIPLDSVVGLETYHRHVNVPGSVALTALTVAVSTLATAAAAVLIFGSCPTIYADSAGTPVLQAEVFATRISPLLEARDIDLLSARPDSTGRLTLEVRNEALETHYINHFEVLEIRHARNVRLIPDEHGRPLLIGPPRAPARATDRAGRNITATLARTDGNVFITDQGTLTRASGEDPFDHIDIAAPRPAGDTAVVTLHLRNSLLNTVLLYDMMLAAPGAGSLDWIARDMRRIGPMFQFGRWYRQHFGLRVSVFDGTKYREIERHPTYGPVAWRDAATVVPVLERDSVRVRLSFAADEWRLDEVAIAELIQRPRARTIAAQAVRGLPDSVTPTVLRGLRRADEHYIETFPGQRFWIAFDAGPGPASRDSTRTFLLASQGYYSEWIRASWVRTGTDTATFKPGAAALDRTFARWRVKRDSIDAAFFGSRIPVSAP